MKKSVLVKIIGVLCAAAVLGVVAYGCYRYFSVYTWIDAVRYRRDETHLDFSGAPLENIRGLQRFYDPEFLDLRHTGLTQEQYGQVRSWYPDCEILWSVPFQGDYVDNTAATVKLTTLEEEDIAVLESLPALTSVDAAHCHDYAALALLRQRCPDLDVSYGVELAGKSYDLGTQSLTLKNADGEELLKRLEFLPQLQNLTLIGSLPSPGQIADLRQTYPAVAIQWEYTYRSVSVAEDTTQLQLSGIPLKTTDLLEEMLSYGPNLQQLEVLGSGLDSESLAQMQQRHPEVRILWDMELGGQRIRTDIAELDISGTPISDPAEIEALLPYLPDVKKIVMCGCGLSNEAMDSLNQRHQDVKFVWNINIGDKAQLRTDATYFMPYQLGIQVKPEDMTELRYCTDMICIDVGHMPITDCEFAAYMPHLKYLIIADTQVSSLEPLKGLKELIYLETFLTNVTDYSPLLSCPALEDLNLCYTSGDPEPLTKMTQLKRLWWGNLRQGPVIPYSTQLMLREALPDTQIEFTGGSTANGWRNHQNYRDMRDILGMFYLS